MHAMQALNLGVQGVLSGYYLNATHRQAIPLPDPADGVPLHHFRAMCHFEPATPFLNELRANGFCPRVFRLEGSEEEDLLDQWPLTAVRAIERFSDHPEQIGEGAVFVGHSAGGFPVYVLAAIARGASLASVREALPGIPQLSALDRIPHHRFRDLSAALSGALFLSIGTPYQGIGLSRIGRPIHDQLVEPYAPLLINSLRTPFLEHIYDRIDRRPADVIHGQMISNAAPLHVSGHPLSLLFDGIMQGGMRLVAQITAYDSYDGIAPWSATYVAGIPEREIIPLDHLRLVETAQPARRLLQLIRRSERLRVTGAPR